MVRLGLMVRFLKLPIGFVSICKTKGDFHQLFLRIYVSWNDILGSR
jgi:hypothetical protein